MIYLSYFGLYGKTVKILLQAAIIKKWTIINNTVVIEFKTASPGTDKVKGKAPSYEWTFQKSIDAVINWHDIKKFLENMHKDLPTPGAVKTETPAPDQQSLF